MRGMEWILSHRSALEFWREASAEDALAGKKLRYVKPPAGRLSVKERQDEKFRNFDMPLHVLVGNDNARTGDKNLHCHICSGEFPAGSFMRTDSGLIVSSPELCFLQMAAVLSFTDLVALGYEFCGRYRRDKKSAKGQGFRGDLPLTSAAGLSAYAARAVYLKGRTKVLKALRYIADGSASPMETILAMMLTLPYKYGGYGFPEPLLNYCIEVPISAGKAKYYCDLYWPGKRVDVEYDSDAFHTGPDRIAKDAIKRNALTGAGITAVTVSRKQIIDMQEFRELAELLSKLLGKRLQYPKKDFDIRRAELMEQLLHINLTGDY